jgi:hypothetical protein
VFVVDASPRTGWPDPPFEHELEFCKNVVEALAGEIEDQNVVIGVVTFATSATVRAVTFATSATVGIGDPGTGPATPAMDRVVQVLYEMLHNASLNLGADGSQSETNIHTGLAAARVEIFAPLASRDTDFVVILTDGKIHNGAGGRRRRTGDGAFVAARALAGMVVALGGSSGGGQGIMGRA